MLIVTAESAFMDGILTVLPVIISDAPDILSKISLTDDKIPVSVCDTGSENGEYVL